MIKRPYGPYATRVLEEVEWPLHLSSSPPPESSVALGLFKKAFGARARTGVAMHRVWRMRAKKSTPRGPPADAPVTPRGEAESPLDAFFSSSLLQAKLRAVEELRATLAGFEDIGCPGIVVIGAQNAGKSSLLESLSGVAFPRGEGMCTRCPTVVSLEVDPRAVEPKVTISTDPTFAENRRTLALTEGATIRDEISRLMGVLAPAGTVTPTPIYIKVVRRAGPTLTVCDLPGITAMSAAQEDVEEATTELTARWAANPNVVMLACVPASDDFHNSKALKIALQARTRHRPPCSHRSARPSRPLPSPDRRARAA